MYLWTPPDNVGHTKLDKQVFVIKAFLNIPTGSLITTFTELCKLVPPKFLQLISQPLL